MARETVKESAKEPAKKVKIFEYHPEGSGWGIPGLEPGTQRTADTIDTAGEFSTPCWRDLTPDVMLEHEPETILDMTTEQLEVSATAQAKRNAEAKQVLEDVAKVDAAEARAAAKAEKAAAEAEKAAELAPAEQT